ncbi:hypothetical protein ACRAWD_01955 [Caulobacter segnis]
MALIGVAPRSWRATTARSRRAGTPTGASTSAPRPAGPHGLPEPPPLSARLRPYDDDTVPAGRRRMTCTHLVDRIDGAKVRYPVCKLNAPDYLAVSLSGRLVLRPDGRAFGGGHGDQGQGGAAWSSSRSRCDRRM